MPEKIHRRAIGPEADVNLRGPLADSDKVNSIVPPAPAQIRKAVLRIALRHTGREAQIQLVDNKRHLRAVPTGHISGLKFDQEIA